MENHRGPTPDERTTELKDNSNSVVSLQVSEYPELGPHITFPSQYVHVKAKALWMFWTEFLEGITGHMIFTHIVYLWVTRRHILHEWNTFRFLY